MSEHLAAVVASIHFFSLFADTRIQLKMGQRRHLLLLHGRCNSVCNR